MDKSVGLDKSEVKTLNDYIAYAHNSIVSKNILDKKSGTISLFAFDAGQGLSEHTAPFDAVVQIIEGEAEVSIAGQPHKVSSGQVIIMPANITHAIKAVKRFKMMLIMIRL